MNNAIQILERTRISNRDLECKSVINRRVKPWECRIKVGNLNIDTTHKMLKGACGRHQPKCITFGNKSYSASDEMIGQAIQRLLSSVGNVEAWTMLPTIKAAQLKAVATFSTMDQATKAVTELNNYSLPQLGGSKIMLSHMVKAKFSILTKMHAAILPELENVRQRLRTKNYLEIKAYPSTDKEHRFTTLSIVSNTAQEVGKAKAAVEKVLEGHTARGGKDIIWNEFFTTREGMTHLNNLGEQHSVFIYSNTRKCILSLYGPEEKKAIVESILIKTVEDLALSTFTIDLVGNMLVAALQDGFRRIVEKLGKKAVRLNITASPKSITVHGSSQDADWARAVLQEEPSPTTKTDAEEQTTCAVCFCNATERYITPCGHIYDRECFVNQCLSADGKDIPIKCLGFSGKCQTVIPFTELEAALSRDQLDTLLEVSFTHRIRTNPDKYQYCPTAGCDQVYEVSDDGKIFTCSTCLTSICTNCATASHEGLTCSQYKSAILGDDAFAEWKRKNNARDCPKCGCTIQKSEGCNHMECKVCKAHICWVCMKVFGIGKETYDHMAREHGSIFDPGYGDD